MKYIAIDIETAGDELRAMASFDAHSVKTGNIKDPTKKQEKIEQARTEHIANAALNPMTSHICAIGVQSEEEAEPTIFLAPHANLEKQLLEDFWKHIRAWDDGYSFHAVRKLVYWGGRQDNNFDVKHIIMRSIKNGVVFPEWANTKWQDAWLNITAPFFAYDKTSSLSLEKAAKWLGVAKERDYDCTGAKFWQTLNENQEVALQYLKDDVEELSAIAKAVL